MHATGNEPNSTISIQPLSPTIGAEVGGFRMDGECTDRTIAEIRQALLDWKVIFFRDQDVSREDHIAFGRRFGELEVHPFATNHPDHPEIVVIHHDENSKSGQNSWHSDVTWREEPSLGSILRGRVIPQVGGDTLFADMHAAYENLSDELRHEIDDLHAIHSYTRVFGHHLSREKQLEMRERYPDVRHPVVRTHPETGAKGLYVNFSFVSHLEGFGEAESRRLLGKLYKQASIPEFQCRFRWRTDSVAFWDNRAVQHYAAFDYRPATRRVERVTVAGDRPY
jgi:taurine dioxygenase